MAITITYFVHGTSTDNENGISSGWQDCELSALGKKQAEDLAHKIAGKKFDVVFCSDLKRATETARIAFGSPLDGNLQGALKIPILPEKRLRECNYGVFCGKPTTLVEPMCETHITKRFPGGESYEDVKARMADFLAELKKNYEGKSVAMVSHKAPQLALEVLLGGKTWKKAFAEDWRISRAWQPGWTYELK